MNGEHRATLINGVHMSPVGMFKIMSFCDENGEVGRIEWENGVVTFRGNLDESAKLFVKHIMREAQGDEPT